MIVWFILNFRLFVRYSFIHSLSDSSWLSIHPWFIFTIHSLVSVRMSKFTRGETFNLHDRFLRQFPRWGRFKSRAGDVIWWCEDPLSRGLPGILLNVFFLAFRYSYKKIGKNSYGEYFYKCFYLNMSKWN